MRVGSQERVCRKCLSERYVSANRTYQPNHCNEMLKYIIIIYYVYYVFKYILLSCFEYSKSIVIIYTHTSIKTKVFQPCSNSAAASSLVIVLEVPVTNQRVTRENNARLKFLLRWSYMKSASN